MSTIICPTCKQDMALPPHKGNSEKDCPQCGQGLSKARWSRVKTRLRRVTRGREP